MNMPVQNQGFDKAFYKWGDVSGKKVLMQSEHLEVVEKREFTVNLKNSP